MAVIRHLLIDNFRSIKKAEWYPRPGLNCLIGPGDSGKSTLLDAIDLALGARRSFAFSDADFHQMNTNRPISIMATLGELSDELKDLEAFGFFLRGFDQANQQIHDEPLAGDETVLTLQLIVREDLDPEWLLYSERAYQSGVEKHLRWKYREMINPTRLGATNHHHLAWGSRSLLNKLSEDTFDPSSSLNNLSRQTRQSFLEQPPSELSDVLGLVRTIANDLGVPVGDLKALLDVKGVSLSNGAISLHNSDNTPLRQMGTGSSRLLISGIQKVASESQIMIVDEAEYGLEPYRISRLLYELGSKERVPSQQVFISTHSPYVLRELQARQLHVLKKLSVDGQEPTPDLSHVVYSLNGGDEEQATLRACAEAFFSKAVIVGEGSTEVGIVRGFDLFFKSISAAAFQDRGLAWADGGGGDKCFKRAEVFASLGYSTVLLKDSDIATPAHARQTQHCREQGVTILEWGEGHSTETATFLWCPLEVIPSLVQLAATLNGQQEVEQHILNCSGNQFNFDSCSKLPVDDMRQSLANAAGTYKWFKNIDKAEQLARNIIGPNLRMFDQRFRSIIDSLYAWAGRNGDQR